MYEEKGHLEKNDGAVKSFNNDESNPRKPTGTYGCQAYLTLAPRCQELQSNKAQQVRQKSLTKIHRTSSGRSGPAIGQVSGGGVEIME